MTEGMQPILARHNIVGLLILFVFVFTSCNMPRQEAATASPPATQAESSQVGSNEPVQIISPQNGARLPEGIPIQVQFTATGGPFIETDLQVDGNFADTAAQDGTSASISGTLSWDAPTGGPHTLTVYAMKPDKATLETSVEVTVEGGTASIQTASSVPQLTGAPGSIFLQDPGYEKARARIIQILHDNYNLNVTAPPVGRKYRYGVTTDPWVSAIYYHNLLIEIALYPDGQETRNIYPLNGTLAPADEKYLGSNDKPIPMCRPSGTIKMLVAFVDYQNLGVSQAEAMNALTRVTTQINAVFANAAQTVGAQSAFLQFQTTGAFLSPPPPMPEFLLSPDLIKTDSGMDPSQYDLTVEVDLDASNTYRNKVLIPQKYDTFGLENGGCGLVSSNTNIWISLDTKDQLDGKDADTRLMSTLVHEFLHAAGYPIGITGAHEWPCGDGSVQDQADECVASNLPTYMLGWTDTDGDGIPEIIDPTPYGIGQ